MSCTNKSGLPMIGCCQPPICECGRFVYAQEVNYRVPRHYDWLAEHFPMVLPEVWESIWNRCANYFSKLPEIPPCYWISTGECVGCGCTNWNTAYIEGYYGAPGPPVPEPRQKWLLEPLGYPPYHDGWSAVMNLENVGTYPDIYYFTRAIKQHMSTNFGSYQWYYALGMSKVAYIPQGSDLAPIHRCGFGTSPWWMDTWFDDSLIYKVVRKNITAENLWPAKESVEVIETPCVPIIIEPPDVEDVIQFGDWHADQTELWFGRMPPTSLIP